MGKFFEILSLIRIRHWVKNIFVFSSIVFSKELHNPDLLVKISAAFLIFCLLSSSIYVFNDIKDIEEDKNHPIKKNRMLPSGRLSVGLAWILFFVFGTVSILGSWLINIEFFTLAVTFFVLNLLYTIHLKHIVIIDVFVIATGFLIRVVAGAYAITVEPSDWLFICSFLLALFLGFCKRRHELVLLEAAAGNHRRVLEKYSPYFLDQMIAVVTSASVVSYILYTVSPETQAQFGTTNMIFTFPFVIYGIFRYLYLVHQREKGGSPTQTLMMDPPLLITIAIWLIATVLIIY